MTGIVILPAGCKDAFEDYKQFVRDGQPIGNIEEFSKLVGYDETYRPQGFTRVADKRLYHLAGEESVETAIGDLANAGERFHPILSRMKTTDQPSN